MKATPILWTYFKTSSKLYPIKIRIADGNKPAYYISIGAKVLKEQFKNGRVKDHPNAQAINLKIISTINSLEKNFVQDGSVHNGDKSSLYWWFDEFLRHSKSKHGVYHQKKMTTVYNKLKEFRPIITKVDLSLVTDYETWLLNKKYHLNYVADQLTRLRTIVKMMVKGGVLEYHKDPFLHFRIKKVKTQKLRLSIADIHLLEKSKLSGNVDLARDMYICSFYGGGVRFGDLCRITKDNFNDGRLRYTMHKTGIEKNIPLDKSVLKIWKKYNFKFPLDIDWSREDLDINRNNTALNKSLKKACKLSGVPEVTFHTARHSIADHAVKNKVPPKGLQGILGHGKLSTTEIYMKSFYQEETDEAMNTLFKKKKAR